jgi:hypothetical protein
MSEVRLLWGKIDRGGFSSERTFSVMKVDGSEYVGVCDVSYVFDAWRRPVTPEEPKEGFGGYVQCRVLRSTETEAVVEFPDSQTTTVRTYHLVRSLT